METELAKLHEIERHVASHVRVTVMPLESVTKYHVRMGYCHCLRLDELRKSFMKLQPSRSLEKMILQTKFRLQLNW